MISKVREVTIEIEISMVTDTHLRVSRTNLLVITKILFLVRGYTLLSVLSVNSAGNISLVLIVPVVRCSLIVAVL